MHYPKLVITGIILLFTVLSCKLEEVQALDETEETSEVEERSDSYVIITNPNGIFLYEKQFDLKSKRTVIPQGTKLYLADAESESDTNFYWSKTSYKKRTGFIISIFPEMNYLVFRKRSSGDGQIQYGLVQEDVDIYELPFKESKVIGKLKSLSVVPILFGYNYGDSLEDNELIPEKVNNGKKVRSSRIKGIMGGAIGDLAASTDREEVTWQEIDSNVRGYVFANIPFVDSKEKGLEYSKKKILKKRSFLKLKNSKPVIYSDLSLKDKKIYKGQIPKNIFLISDLSVSIEDKPTHPTPMNVA